MPDTSHPEQIDRDYVRLLQVMRRFVKQEFEVTIHINQDDVVSQLLHYAEQSTNHVLQEMGKELAGFTQHTSTAANHETPQQKAEHVRYYRGAAIVDDAHEEHSAVHAEQPKEKSRPTRVYRGQVVN